MPGESDFIGWAQKGAFDMNDTFIMRAAETLRSMCTDFRVGGISQATFVSNLELFAKHCRAQQDKVESPGTSSNTQIMPCCCRKDVLLGQAVLVIDNQCSVHGHTA
jgi:hypothetical protein